MNQSVKSYFYLLVLVWGIVSCHSTVTKTPSQAEALLSSPPFASVTDSIHRFPKEADLYLRRALLLSQTNQHEMALPDYEKAWSLHPNEETGFRYASSLAITGKAQEAIKFLQNCINQFPADPQFKRLLGEAYVQAGKTKDASDLYNSLLKTDSTDFESWYEKGLLQAEAKDTPGAIISLQTAYSLQRVNTYALELAHLYAENKNPKSLQICNAIIRQDSANELTDPYFIEGIYYANIQQYPNAITAFDSCIRRDWKFTDAYIEKGIAFFKQKNYDESLNTFRMSATVSNTYPDSYFWIGRCYEAIGKKDEAIINYERAVALDKNFTEAKDALKRIKT